MLVIYNSSQLIGKALCFCFVKPIEVFSVGAVELVLSIEVMNIINSKGQNKSFVSVNLEIHLPNKILFLIYYRAH